MILKRKNRYILVEASSPLDAVAESRSIEAAMLRALGELYYSEANPKVVAQSDPTLFAIRVNRGQEGRVILALSFAREISGRKMGLYTLKTSGTLRALHSLYGNKAPKRIGRV